MYEEYKDYLDPTIVWFARGLFSEYDDEYGLNRLEENGWLDRNIDDMIVDWKKRSYKYFAEPFDADGF